MVSLVLNNYLLLFLSVRLLRNSFLFIMKQYLLMWHHYNQERQRDTILFVASFGCYDHCILRDKCPGVLKHQL